MVHAKRDEISRVTAPAQAACGGHPTAILRAHDHERRAVNVVGAGGCVIDLMRGAMRDFRCDRGRYPRAAWLTERSLWAVATYRLGRVIVAAPNPIRLALKLPYHALYLAMQIVTGIELDPHAAIGPGLRIYHAGPIVVHGAATIGSDCVLNVGNVVGDRDGSGYPRLGDRVRMGASAQVLGGVTVGDDSYIGAMSLVLADVPPRSVVAGIPARVIRGG